MNLYGFVGNNGINKSDILGLEAHLFFVPNDAIETSWDAERMVSDSNAAAAKAAMNHLTLQGGVDFSLWMIKIHIFVDQNGVINRKPTANPIDGLLPVNTKTDIHNFSDQFMSNVFRNEQQSKVFHMPYKENDGLNEFEDAVMGFVSGDPNYSYDFFTVSAHGDREGRVGIGGLPQANQAVINLYRKAAKNYLMANHAICGVSGFVDGKPATCITEFIPFEISYDFRSCTIDIIPAQSGAGGFEEFLPRNE